MIRTAVIKVSVTICVEDYNRAKRGTHPRAKISIPRAYRYTAVILRFLACASAHRTIDDSYHRLAPSRSIFLLRACGGSKTKYRRVRSAEIRGFGSRRARHIMFTNTSYSKLAASLLFFYMHVNKPSLPHFR